MRRNIILVLLGLGAGILAVWWILKQRQAAAAEPVYIQRPAVTAITGGALTEGVEFSPLVTRVQYQLTSLVGPQPIITRFKVGEEELQFGEGTTSQRKAVLQSEMDRMIELPASTRTRIETALSMGLIDQAEQIFTDWEESR